MKVEIAFALARRPEYIILDETLANIDPIFKTDILELLQKVVSIVSGYDKAIYEAYQDMLRIVSD